MAALQLRAMTEAQQALCAGDFIALDHYLATLANSRQDDLSTMKIAPFVTAFRTASLRAEQVDAALKEDVSVVYILLSFPTLTPCLLCGQRPHYAACKAVPQLRPYLPAGVGGIALVVSAYQNAVQSRDANDWHAVVVIRKGSTLWIFNPEFNEASYSHVLRPLRLASICGVRVVQSLVKNIGAVGASIQHCFMQGLNKQEGPTCIGRSVQWMEDFLDGSNADPFQPGRNQLQEGWVSLDLTSLYA